MSRAGREADLAVRPYRAEDESGVLKLLRASLGGGPAGERPAEFFRWKHLENPFGASFLLVAEDSGRIIGLRAFMRWRFVAGGRTLTAVRAVDTATHPDHQGRGIFSRLTLQALDELRGEVDLVFNTPNEKSFPGYLRMGWRTVGRIPISIRVRRPVRFLREFRALRVESASTDLPRVEAETAAEALRDEEQLEALLSGEDSLDPRLSTPRAPSYLRWRYASAPLLDYSAVRLEEGGRLRGLALFRVRPRGRLVEATVAEVLVAHGDREAGARVLRRVARSAPVDHLTCHFPAGSAAARAATRSGFLRSRNGMIFVVNPLREGIEPDPTALGSWALSLGDLEVF